jgi:hypothetical protein
MYDAVIIAACIDGTEFRRSRWQEGDSDAPVLFLEPLPHSAASWRCRRVPHDQKLVTNLTLQGTEEFGHTWRLQRTIACSSRWMARVSGLCGEKPRSCNNSQHAVLLYATRNSRLTIARTRFNVQLVRKARLQRSLSSSAESASHRAPRGCPNTETCVTVAIKEINNG